MAWAHAPVPGVKGFYVGLLHPFSMAAELLVLLAFSLLVSQHRSIRENMWKSFALGSIVGLGLATGSWITFDANLPLLVLTVCVGLSVAGALSLPLPVALFASAAIGFLVGRVSLADPGPLAAVVFTTSGAFLGAHMLFFLVTAGLFKLKDKIYWPSMPVAFRVAGSWISAISILLAAVTFHEKV
jgi:hydrogenase/urease accessory protein HupE